MGRHVAFLRAVNVPRHARLTMDAPGFVIDDLRPQASWPEGHAAKIPPLVDAIERRADVTTVRLAWSSGLLLAVRRG